MSTKKASMETKSKFSHPFFPWISRSYHCDQSSRCRWRSWWLVGGELDHSAEKGRPTQKSNAPFKPHTLLSHHRLGLWCGRLKLMLAQAETSWLPVELVCLQKVVAVTTLPGTSAEQNHSASRIRFQKQWELLKSVCFWMQLLQKQTLGTMCK